MAPAGSGDRRPPDLAGVQAERFDYPAVGRVTAGVPCLEAVPDEVERLGARRAMLFVSASLERRTRLAEALGRALGARHAGTADCQRGAWLAATALGRVPVGASHGLGHLLAGLAGVPHGLTSALLLASVLRYNRAANADRQALCARALGAEDAAEAVAALVERLGLRQPLADLRLSAEGLRPVAEAAPGHFLVRGNPRPIRNAAEAMAILTDALCALPSPS